MAKPASFLLLPVLSPLNKSISRGKTTTYYFELAPWGPQPEVDDAEVDRETYEQLEVGDTVEVLFLKGPWGIPWYVVQSR